MARVRTQRKNRRIDGRMMTVIVAAERGVCARCTQPIKVGERVGNERGFASHRDCIRLHVAVPRARTEQVSDGWGSICAGCGSVIERGSRWVRVGDKVRHADCGQTDQVGPRQNGA